jgi:NADPH2:quinone reductase
VLVRAILSETAGPAESLRLVEVPDPVPAKGQVIVAVRACGVNYLDTLIIQDKYQVRPPRPFIPGSEFAGVVETLGEGVAGLSVGDRVGGSVSHGAMAEKVAVAADQCFVLPRAMPFAEAAAFLLNYVTSYHALHERAGIKAGEILLVLGAGSGVGLAAVELGKAAGARVIAAASSEDKLALAMAAGAADGIVYPRGPLEADAAKALGARFKQASGGEGVDIVYDGVGGTYTEPALRATAWGGRLLVIGFPAGIPSIPLNLPLLKSVSIVGVYTGAWMNREPLAYRAAVRRLFELYESGAIKPRISLRLPLEKAGEAIAALAARRVLGKAVVIVGAD